MIKHKKIAAILAGILVGLSASVISQTINQGGISGGGVGASTGTGLVVRQTTPTLITPDIGVATGTSLINTNTSNAANTLFSAVNASAGTAATSLITVSNGTNNFALRMHGTGFTTSGINVANGAQIRSSSSALGFHIGTASAIALTFFTNDTARWLVGTTGHLNASIDNVNNIGADATNRPATINAGTAVKAPAFNATTSIVVGGGATVSALTYGTCTPTLTNVANASASTSYIATYLRVGDSVTQSGQLDIDSVAAATFTDIGISLCVASAFTLGTDLAGTAASGSVVQSGQLVADATNDRASLWFISADTANRNMSYTFTYQVK